MTVEEVLEMKRLPEAAEWPASRGDVEKLFWKVKGLRLDQSRKEAFWSATNENLQQAYAQLERQERELELAYGQIQRYLENIREGLLLIDRDYVIQGQYSAYLEEMFRTANIEGRNLIDFLFPDSSSQEESRNELRGFLDILFSSKNASDRMIQDVNPLVGRVITVGENQTERRAMDAKFTRIAGDAGVDGAMVIFVDRTEEVEIRRKLELEESRHESEVETISAILKNGPTALLDFIGESTRLVESLKQEWNRLGDQNVRTRLFKEVHSLKGVSKYFELHHVSSLAHTIEELISAAGAGNPAPREEFLRIIEQLESGIAGIDALNHKLMHFSKTVGEQTGESETQRFFASLQDMISGIADELEKQVQVTIHAPEEELPEIARLQKPLIHLARNAIDHGIEGPYQRLSADKPMLGTVRIAAQLQQGECLIDVEDDGAGVDFAGIEKRARELGLIREGSEATQAQLLKVIFSPNFSSHLETSEISGRGLGLDIVHDVVKELGGRISVRTIRGQGTRFRLRIPVVAR